MKKRSAIVAGIALAAGLISGGASWSQQASNNASPEASPRVSSQPSVDDQIRDAIRSVKRRNDLNRIPQILEKLREIDVTRPASSSGSTGVTKSGAEEKADLTRRLEAAIAEGFDEDMRMRERDLASLEQRVSKLRTLLDRRRKAKAEILQLQLKVLLNQAEGLGFTDFERGVKNGHRVPDSAGDASFYIGVSK